MPESLGLTVDPKTACPIALVRRLYASSTTEGKRGQATVHRVLEISTMPPKQTSPGPALTMDRFHDYLASQSQKWADLIKNDPRRVCRVLLLYSPRGETVEGDTYDDIPILFQELKTVSHDSTSKSWKGLVDAGVITALSVHPPPCYDAEA